MIGETIAHYTVTEKIGQGGMGEVYRATDTRLQREVALKILPPEFTDDPHRMARFTQEAQVLASLNHPHIGAIHGLEEQGDVGVLVLELVEGENLSEIIARGAIPLEKSLRIALQISAALEAALERGIVHRDLKPANVKITPAGQVKVLDFGLAKVMRGDPQSGPDLSQAKTVGPEATQSGMILGTAAYMSPQQARGEEVDHRADVWAFGVILYEMLTGIGPFRQKTVSDTMVAVLKEEPAWELLPSSTPPSVHRLLRRCLRKDPTERLRHIGDAGLELEDAVEGDAIEGPSLLTSRKNGRYSWRTVLLLAGLGVLIGALLSGALWRSGGGRPRSAHLELFLDPPIRAIGGAVPFAISPDGQRIVYQGGTFATESRLYLRDLNDESRQAHRLPHPEGTAYAPFFSPDGEWIAFQMIPDRRLMRLHIDSGVVRPIAEAIGPVLGASWGDDDSIVFLDNLGRLWQVSADGGTPLPVETPERTANFVIQGTPRLLPGGRAALVTTVDPSGGTSYVETVSLETGTRRRVGPGSDSRYLSTPTGHLVYVDGESLSAAPFDAERNEVVGEAVLLPYRVAGPTGNHWYQIAENGWLFYGSSEELRPARLTWVDRSGQPGRSIGQPSTLFLFPSGPQISPDGQRIAYSAGLPTDIRVLDLSADREIYLTRDEHLDLYPVWINDGQDIVYLSSREGGQYKLFIQPADGSGEPELLLESDYSIAPTSYSTDSRLLAYYEIRPDTLRDLWILDMKQGRTFEFLATPANERGAAFSPDGNWITYVSDRDGRDQVYLKRYPDDGALYQVSTDGGTGPIWAPDGREILYWRDNSLLTVGFTAEPEVSILPPKTLFEGAYVIDAFGNAAADIAPDGRHLITLTIEEGGFSRLNVVTNWFEELNSVTPKSDAGNP